MKSDNENKDRFRSQMLLCTLEQSMAEFITTRWSKLTLENPTIKQILIREPLLDSKEFSESLVHSITQSSFLKELFDLCAAVTKGTQENECIEKLQKLSTELELFNIRNAAAHPNRKFFQYYWFRLAAISSDPTIARLGMFKVYEGLEQAIDGNIDSPPPEWFQKIPEIPNNLPLKFDHTATGLIGRDEERRRLWDDFSNPRKHYFAVIAPGGNGKTALVLDFLDELTCSTRGQELADAVVFVTMKTNSLTYSGVIHHKVARSLEEIEDKLHHEIEAVTSDSYSSFIDAKQKCSHLRLVICIDNLETLLLDKPDALSAFESELPEKWRLIVTSRIAVEDAVSLPLMPLKLPAAKQLVRQYVNTCGYPQPDQTLVDSVAKGTKCNPLSIKLVVDAYVAGSDISDSITKAVNDTTEFSFSNLIDVLPEHCICVLESLFVDEDISRFSLSEALGHTPDEITKAIHDLCRTSLVTRSSSNQNGREIFKLNDQVRELLRLHPKRIGVRETVEKFLRARRAQTTTSSKSPDKYYQYRWDVIEDDLPEDLKAIVIKVNQATTKTKSANAKLPDAYRQVIHAEIDFASFSSYWRARARILWALQDRSEGLNCLHKAIELNAHDVISQKLLAEWLIEDQRSSEALPYLENLLTLGADNPDNFGIDFSSHVIASHLYAKIFLRRFEEVSNATEKWLDRDDEIGWVKATARIRCFLRWAEDTHEANSEKRFIHALSEFDSAAQHFGLSESMEHLGAELVEEFCKRMRFTNPSISEEAARSGIEFISKYHRELVITGSNAYREMEKSIHLIKEYISRWNKIDKEVKSTTSPEYLDSYRAEGYVIARIVIPFSFYERNSTSFLFARDDSGEDYFIHASSFVKDSSYRWRDLKQDSVVALKRSLQSEGSAKWKSIETKLVSI